MTLGGFVLSPPRLRTTTLSGDSRGCSASPGVFLIGDTTWAFPGGVFVFLFALDCAGGGVCGSHIGDGERSKGEACANSDAFGFVSGEMARAQ